MNIIFFGTPDFVLPIPEALLKAGYRLAIVTTPDMPVGRRKIPTPSPVKSWAVEHKIPVLTPGKLDSNFKFQISNFKFDLGILAAYGHIIPQNIIDLFPKGILVVHPSLLPKYRGPSPVQSALMADEKTTGSTILQMDEKMDHGPIVAQFEEEIKDTDTAQDLYDRLFKKSAEVLVQVLPDYLSGKIELKEQDHSKATYTKIIKKEDGFVPWSELNSALKGQTTINPALPAGRHSPLTIYNLIRALSPWPGVWTLITITEKLKNEKTEKRLKILKAHLEPIPNSQFPLSKLVLDMVQLEGKNPVPWKQFIEANPEVIK